MHPAQEGRLGVDQLTNLLPALHLKGHVRAVRALDDGRALVLDAPSSCLLNATKSESKSKSGHTHDVPREPLQHSDIALPYSSVDDHPEPVLLHFTLNTPRFVVSPHSGEQLPPHIGLVTVLDHESAAIPEVPIHPLYVREIRPRPL